ncbi:S26 family signal peptidase [Nonomuraea cavernae]|uniref:S26 family signal peptidase n=1 Tax=Nonomuraea cavernae TaxID=2045107 RepID=UPI0033F1844F
MIGVITATVALLVLAVLAIRHRVLVVSVVGRSMSPTLSAGDRVLVRRTPVGRVRRDDVVLIRRTGPCRPGDPAGTLEGALLVKRVAAVAGDLEPAWLPAWCRSGGGVAPGTIVVLGDNLEVSQDSRHFGAVPGDQVLGVVLRRLGGDALPPGRASS